MKSRTSFFNKTLYWKDITRFWPLWTVEIVFVMLFVIIPVFSGMSRYEEMKEYWGDCSSRQVLGSLLEDCGPCLTHGMILGLVSLVVALCLFSYLFKTRETYHMHFLPMKRETLFFSHYLAGVTILLIPFIATYGVLICVAASYRAGMTMQLLGQLVVTLVGVLFFFTLACLMIMLTANKIMTTVIYVVVNVLYQAVAAMFVLMGSVCIYGYQGDDSMITNTLGQYLTPIAFFSGESSIFGLIMGWSHEYLYYRYETAYMEYAGCSYSHGYPDNFWIGPEWNRAIWYLIPTVLFLGLAIWLYRKRSLESAGNMLAFSWGKPVFRLVFTLVGSMAFSILIYWICIGSSQMQITYQSSFLLFWGLLTGGSLMGYLISNMILHKTFWIWKKTSYLRMLLLTAMIVGVFSYMKYGYGEKIPSVNSVDFVKVKIQQGAHYNLENTFYIQGEEQLQKFQKKHERILEAGKNEVIDDDRNHVVKNVKVIYVTKSGKQIERNYPLRYDVWKRIGLVNFLNAEENMREKVFTNAYEEATPLLAKFVYNDGKVMGSFHEYDIMYRLYDAALKDMEEGNLVLEQRDSEQYYLDIRINLPKECKEKYGLSDVFMRTVNENETMIELPVSESCKHLTKLMEETVFYSESEE